MRIQTTFEGVLHNQDDQVLVRQILSSLLTQGQKDRVVEQFNAVACHRAQLSGPPATNAFVQGPPPCSNVWWTRTMTEGGEWGPPQLRKWHVEPNGTAWHSSELQRPVGAPRSTNCVSGVLGAADMRVSWAEIR